MPQLPAQSVDALVTANLDLPGMIARQVAREMGMPLSLDDLEAAGREGLVRSAQKFDEGRGVPFRRFAHYRIRGAVIDSLRRESTLPRRARKKLIALQATLDVNEAASEDLAAPTAPGTTNKHLDLRLADHLANVATAMAIGLVATTATQGEESIPVDDRASVEDALVEHQMLAHVRDAVAGLPDQERALIQRHYFQGERFDLIAVDLGLSKSWASRLHTRAIARLTDHFRRDRL